MRARRVKYLVVFCSCASHTGCVLKLAEDEREPEGGLREKIRESADQKAALSVSGFLPFAFALSRKRTWRPLNI